MVEVCSWNWEAITGFASSGATLVAAGVAWKISEKWRDQKASEVIAKEAQSLLLLIQEYQYLCNEIFCMIVLQQEKDDSKIAALQLLTGKMRENAIFFYELTGSKEPSVIQLKDEVIFVYKRLVNNVGVDRKILIMHDENFTFLSGLLKNAFKESKQVLMEYFIHKR